MIDVEQQGLDGLLEYLRRVRGFDFAAYKQPSLMRRVRKRLEAVKVDTFADYTDYLEVHPEEFGHLFNVILINVTTFFRDEPAWTFLRDEIVPGLVNTEPNKPIRVWTAACASGEETYSIAMLLVRALGPEPFRDRVKIYATDVDEDALAQARAASYTAKQVASVPPDLLAAYFSQEGGRYVFDRELRRSVIFGRHDLIQDAPISRVDLLICRNTLMYFHSEAQARILARFHFALGDSGILFLGKAEMLLSHSQMFVPIDMRRRIFKKVHKDHWRDRLAILATASRDDPAGHPVAPADLPGAAFDNNPMPQVIVDADALLLMFNERARSAFSLGPIDIGRPLQDLQVPRPMELRLAVDHAAEHARPMTMKDVAYEPAGAPPRYYEVHVVPTGAGEGLPIAYTITFVDSTRAQDLELQLARSKQDLETAYEELQSTNEELETTNEELQSTVEELETTNEELQSTNEELETMNEELQSTNEELQTINEELRERGEELNRANSFLESILTGVRSGVIVVDRDLRVIAWNARSEHLWGLRADEVSGENFLNLDIGLPTVQLRGGVRACLSGEMTVWDTEVSAVNRRGRAVLCRVTCTPLLAPTRDVRGVIIMADEVMTAPAEQTH